MKQIHKQRLKRLAEYLLTKVPREKFDMAFFRNGEHNRHICSTAGCALGWAPAIMLPSTHRKYLRSEEVYESINKLYHIIGEKYFGIEPFHDSEIWDYLFSYSWSRIDNTPQGAAARILYFLDHGIPNLFNNDTDANHWDTSHYQKYLTTGA